MRLKRIYQDFRVTEQVDENQLLGEGPYTVYRVTKRGLTTFEAVDLLAKTAGVERTEVATAGLKDKDGVTGQFMTVLGGRRVDIKDRSITVRPLGRSERAIESTDSTGNSFEIVVRDLSGDDMRRIRINLSELKEIGMPNYFDDQRFGCLRHGQGFIVRSLLSGKAEDALRALLAAPSKYGSEKVESFKTNLQNRWGDWAELASYCRGRRGASVFEHLVENKDDFVGALERGVATRERTIHLFAWQSYLWNRAAGFILQDIVGKENVSWLPGDAGSLPVAREVTAEQRTALEAVQLPLLGPDADLSDRAQAAYEHVFRGEGVTMEQFLALDISGFRPHTEERPFLVRPQYLRAAPAEQDDIYRKRQKMRLRFTLPRGHYATLICKRLMMPTEKNSIPLRMWISRHPLDWPMDDGTPRLFQDEDRRHHSERGRPRQTVGEYRASKEGGGREWGGPSRDHDDNRGGRDDRRDHRDDCGNRGPSSPWGDRGEGRGDRDNDRSSAWGSKRDDDRGDRGDRSERSDAWGGRGDNDRGGERGGDRENVWGGKRDDDRGEPRRDRAPSPWGNAGGGGDRDDRGGYGRRDDRGDRGGYGGRDDRGSRPVPNRGKPAGWPEGVAWNEGSSEDRS